MFISKKHLSRRTILRGMGVSLALPLLDSMLPAQTPLAKTAAVPVRRLGFFYISNGHNIDKWVPVGEGREFQFSPTLKPVEPLRDSITVVTGLGHPNGYSLGDGAGDHARGSAVWLNGVHPKRTEGEDVRAGITADQVAAQAIGSETALPSLELALEATALLGVCDAGYSCTYMNTLVWRTPTMPLPMEVNPRVTFERMFGDGGSPAARTKRLKQDASILDSITAEANRLQGNLGARDRNRISEYLDTVREIERRIQLAEKQSEEGITPPEAPPGLPESYDERAKLTFDMLTVAFQADITRVFTLMMAHEVSERAYPQIGVPESNHGISHHQNDPVKLEKYAKVNQYHVGLFGSFLERLRSTSDGDGNLLDHSAMLFGSGLGDGNAHNHGPLAALVGGHAGGNLRGGQHVKFADGLYSNLLVTLLDSVGVKDAKLGDSTGPIAI